MSVFKNCQLTKEARFTFEGRLGRGNHITGRSINRREVERSRRVEGALKGGKDGQGKQGC